MSCHFSGPQGSLTEPLMSPVHPSATIFLLLLFLSSPPCPPSPPSPPSVPLPLITTVTLVSQPHHHGCCCCCCCCCLLQMIIPMGQPFANDHLDGPALLQMIILSTRFFAIFISILANFFFSSNKHHLLLQNISSSSSNLRIKVQSHRPF